MAERRSDVELTLENGVWTRISDPPTENWKNLGRILVDGMKKVPERVAQIDALTGETDTYGALLDRAVRCAVWLRKENIKPRDFIGVCTCNHLDTFVPFLAAIFNGITFHPWWDISLEKNMVEYFLKQGEPKVMFVDKEKAELVQAGIDELGMNTKVIVFQESPGVVSLRQILREQSAEDVKNFECTTIESLDHPAIMVSTSGSTGDPKGSLHSYNWLEEASYYIPLKYIVGKRMLWSSGICWITALGSSMSLLRHCSTAVIHPKLNAQKICELIEKYKVNTLITVVYITIQFYKEEIHRGYDLSSLEYFLFGGACITEEADRNLMKLFPQAETCFSYGSSEIGLVLRREQTNGKFGFCGKIREHCQIKIIDIDTGKTLGANEEGEICIKSSYLMLKYHKDPESTAEAIDSEGWYHSGDLGYYDTDGNFYVIDRMKQLIKFNYEYLTPSVIEKVILKHPDVIEAAVVPKPNINDVEHAMAFVSIRDNSDVTEETIIKQVQDNLPDRMRLRGGVKILNRLPTTAAGKIAKKTLREMAKVLAAG